MSWFGRARPLSYVPAMSVLGPDAKSAPEGRLSLKARFVTALFPALLGPSQVLLFGPHTLYAGNADEFTLSFWILLAPLLVILFTSVASLLAVALVCSARWYPLYVTLLFGVGLGLWLQGNLFLGNYGLLDGTSIDWSQHSNGIGELIALWIGLPFLLALFANRLMSSATTASGVLIALQLGVMAISAPRLADDGAKGGKGWQEPPALTFQFSNAQNIVHLILDGFQADIFGEIVEDDEALRRELEGLCSSRTTPGPSPRRR